MFGDNGLMAVALASLEIPYVDEAGLEWEDIYLSLLPEYWD